IASGASLRASTLSPITSSTVLYSTSNSHWTILTNRFLLSRRTRPATYQKTQSIKPVPKIPVNQEFVTGNPAIVNSSSAGRLTCIPESAANSLSIVLYPLDLHIKQQAGDHGTKGNTGNCQPWFYAKCAISPDTNERTAYG